MQYQTSADVLSSSSPRQQRGRVPIMANSSIPPRNECPTGKRNQSSNNQTQITQYVRPPESTRTHHETILKLGKSSPAINQSQLERPPGPRATKYRGHHNEAAPQGSNTTTNSLGRHPHHCPKLSKPHSQSGNLIIFVNQYASVE